MIRTKKTVLAKIKQDKKAIKKLQIEYLTLHQIDKLKNTGILIREKIVLLTGRIEALMEVAHTVEPRNKSTKKKKSDN